jgi:hypothetical protein
MGWATLSGIRGSIAKVAVMIAIPAVSLAVPAYAAPGFGGTPKTLGPLGNPTSPDNPTCALDPANANPLNPPCQPNSNDTSPPPTGAQGPACIGSPTAVCGGGPYDDGDVDTGFGGIADTGISGGGVADSGVGIGDSGVGGIP